MKKVSTHFLRVIIVLIGLIVLALSIFVLPKFSQHMATVFPSVPYLNYFYLIGWATTVPFIFALWQGLKLLKYVDMGNAFSERSIIAIRNIQRSAIAIGVLYAIGMPLAFGVAQADDAPGLILMYGVIIGAPIVVAVFASVIKKILRSAVDMKSENDLTV